MILERVVLLAGYTARATAYVQALNRAGLVPELTVLYGNSQADRPGQGGRSSRPGSEALGLFLPDLSVSLTTSLEQGGWTSSSISAESANDPAVINQLKGVSPTLIIFCGYGGEIVSAEALEVSPYLHVHSGWLPGFRGSTTGYYSWLEGNGLAASAILLNSKIDSGAILMRKRYPVRPPGIDMDYVWDSALRADLLVLVMKHFALHGAVPDGEEQSPEEGRVFYVIHPVLKHLALLGND